MDQKTKKGFVSKIKGVFDDERKQLKKLDKIAQEIISLEDKYSALSDEELANQTNVLKEKLNSGSELDDILVDAFAVAREAAWRQIHLKAFKETGRLKDFKRSINHIGFMMKPVFKDGRMDLYEISYQKGMDMSEEEALERFENIAERIYKNERHLRNEQVSKNRSEMEDSYYKALGTLKYGYFLSQEEIYNMVSNLLYGYSFGLREISLENIWLLVCMSQKYHLIEYKESVNSTRTLDSVRGDYIREFLKEAPYGQ